MGITVDAPDGRTWHVSRQLHWPQWRGWGDDGNPLLDVVSPLDFDPGDSFIAGLVIGIVIFLVLAALIVVLLPVILLLAEVVLAVTATVVALRPWVVRATTVGPPLDERVWGVRGFLRSRRAMAEVADELRRGVQAEPTEWEAVR